MHGANPIDLPIPASFFPLPPYARGKPAATSAPATPRPSTPVCTGQTKPAVTLDIPHRLYPRMHGANYPRSDDPTPRTPLPPYARGKRFSSQRGGRQGPSSPVCTGQTRDRVAHHNDARLYPRMHGANLAQHSTAGRRKPLPPYARGEPRGAGRVQEKPASTPACAGQTERGHVGIASLDLYPRVRGANSVSL